MLTGIAVNKNTCKKILIFQLEVRIRIGRDIKTESRNRILISINTIPIHETGENKVEILKTWKISMYTHDLWKNITSDPEKLRVSAQV